MVKKAERLWSITGHPYCFVLMDLLVSTMLLDPLSFSVIKASEFEIAGLWTLAHNGVK